ncbi:hypothetical protein K503DRAFT_869767 [Rhizopogon vinicolor AM-OR11-026]|uniref:Uncharacterized protein n=1 Tax=Rhizopogon vinicolor AM-OR11-026 TaxID=1314800 RepID=A0A1B7MKG9_9AGAM|nr:hypothetical protein K503DRAFT_869767 [Rhizopogon vinicolor AM-OR11-026]
MPIDASGSSTPARTSFRFDLNHSRPTQYDSDSRSSYSTNDWKKFVSMTGMPYYFSSRLRILTPDDMMDPDIRSSLLEVFEEHIESIEEEYELPRDSEHVLWRVSDSEPELSEEEDTGRRSSSSEDSVSADPSDDFAIYCASLDLGSKIGFGEDSDEYEHHPPQSFWQHLAEYSMHYRRITPQLEAQFLCALAHGATEQVIGTGQASFPFDDHQCKSIMQVYNILKARSKENNGVHFLPALLWHIARIMEDVWHCRSRHRYGIISRPENDVPTEPSWISRYFDFMMICLLFGRHSSYHRRLEATRPNGKVYIPEFRACMEGLVSEWTDSNLLATVFVLASVGFLSIPDIGTIQRLSSLASTLFGLTSVTSGIHHTWRHKRKIDAEHDDAHGYVSHIRFFGSAMDLRLTACFLCLPIATLMWSVLSFMITIISYCFQCSGEIGQAFLAVLTVIITLCIAGAFLCFWYETVAKED